MKLSGFVEHLEQFLMELSRVTKAVIFICVPNRFNVSHMLRSRFKKNFDGIFLDNLNPNLIKPIMSKFNWHIKTQGFFDIPPWPDIAMTKEDLLQKIGLRRLFQGSKKTAEDYICILDYFSGKKRELKRQVLRYAFLEDSPKIIRRFWAHHQYFIFTPSKPF